MKFTKKWLAIALATAIMGAFSVGIASADASSTQSTTQPQSAIAQDFLGNLASALNISQSMLTAGLQTAASQTVNQAVYSGQITQTQANQILSRINQGNLPFLGFANGHKNGGFGKRQGGGAFMTLKPLATALNMTPQAVISAIKGGQTVAELAATAGTTVDALQGRIQSSVQTQLAQAVQNGKMTQAQETQILQNISSGNWVTQIQQIGQHMNGRQQQDQTATSQSAQ